MVLSLSSLMTSSSTMLTETTGEKSQVQTVLFQGVDTLGAEVVTLVVYISLVENFLRLSRELSIIITTSGDWSH